MNTIERISHRKRISTGLLLLHVLALLQPQRVDASFLPADRCVPEACTDSTLGIRSHAPALSAAGQYQRVFSDPTRQVASALDQFRCKGGIPETYLGSTAALFASGTSATLKHSNVAHVLRSARLGFHASAPRSPPLIR